MRTILLLFIFCGISFFGYGQDLQTKLANSICSCYDGLSSSLGDFDFDTQTRDCREAAIGTHREEIVELAGSDDDNALFRTGRKEVVKSLTTLIETCPAARKAHLRLLELNLKYGEEPRSKGVVANEIAKVSAEIEKSNNVRFLLQRALLHEEMGNTEKALEDVETMVEDNPENSHFLLLSALFLNKLNKPKPALDKVDQLLKLNPDHEEGLVLKALLKLKA